MSERVGGWVEGHGFSEYILIAVGWVNGRTGEHGQQQQQTRERGMAVTEKADIRVPTPTLSIILVVHPPPPLAGDTAGRRGNKILLFQGLLILAIPIENQPPTYSLSNRDPDAPFQVGGEAEGV